MSVAIGVDLIGCSSLPVLVCPSPLWTIKIYILPFPNLLPSIQYSCASKAAVFFSSWQQLTNDYVQAFCQGCHLQGNFIGHLKAKHVNLLKLTFSGGLHWFFFDPSCYFWSNYIIVRCCHASLLLVNKVFELSSQFHKQLTLQRLVFKPDYLLWIVEKIINTCTLLQCDIRLEFKS